MEKYLSSDGKNRYQVREYARNSEYFGAMPEINRLIVVTLFYTADESCQGREAI